jgi:putative peptidoglycan lipid II flippase
MTMQARARFSKYYLFKNAGITATMGGLGAATGLVLDAMILSTFGAGYQTDALFTALIVPVLLTGIFSIQCPKILVPVFSEYFSRNEDMDAWGLLTNLLTTCTVVLGGICLVGIMLSGIIVYLEIPGLGAETVVLGTGLSRILFITLLAQGLASILQSALYARHSYVISSSGKMVGNVVTILVVAITHNQLGIRSVASGMLLGNLIQVALLAVVLFKYGFRYQGFSVRPDSRLAEILKSFGYPLSGHILGESATILQSVLGSFLGAGSVTIIRYGARVTQAIAGILLGSVVQVTLPLIAKHAAMNDLKAQRKALLESIQLLGVIGLPVCIWLALTAKPLITLFFERGQFSSANSLMTALVIQLMIPDIILGRLVSVTQTIFYSNRDLRTPLISTVIYTVVNLVLAILLTHSLGLLGIPIAVSLASLSNASYMISRLQKRFGPMGWSEIRSFALRLGATCMIGGIGLLIGKLLPMATMSYSLVRLIDVAVPTGFGVCAFIVGGFLFGLIDTRALLVTAKPAS